MAYKFSVSFKTSEEQRVSLTIGEYKCVKEDYKSRLLACGTSEGVLQIAKFTNTKVETFNKAIGTDTIESVDWIANGLIVTTSTTPQLAIYDPIKDTTSFYSPNKSNIRLARAISPNEVLLWYRTGLTVLADLRSKDKPLEIEDNHPVTVANIHPSNRNILYTTTVPGTSLNVWDLRYTKRGKYTSTSSKISNQHACDLKVFNGNLFVMANTSKVFKISETGRYFSVIANTLSNQPRSYGSLLVNEKYKSLFMTTHEGLHSLVGESLSTVYKSTGLIGCNGSKNILFVYTKNEIVRLQIKPTLTFARDYNCVTH